MHQWQQPQQSNSSVVSVLENLGLSCRGLHTNVTFSLVCTFQSHSLPGYALIFTSVRLLMLCPDNKKQADLAL